MLFHATELNESIILDFHREKTKYHSLEKMAMDALEEKMILKLLFSSTMKIHKCMYD